MSKDGKGPDIKPELLAVRKKNSYNKNFGMATLSKVRIQRSQGDGNTPTLFVFTLLVIYKSLYILGATLLRRRRSYAKKISVFLRGFAAAFRGMLEIPRQKTALLFMGFWIKLKAPFARIRIVYMEQKKVVSEKRKENLIPWVSYIQIMEAVGRLIVKIFATIINHIVPVAALILLLFAINGFLNQTFGLEVTYNNEQIGYIQNESDFDAAARDVRNRIISETSTTYTTAVPGFEIVICETPGETNPWMMMYNDLLKKTGLKIVKINNFTTNSELADKIIRLSGLEVEEAYGLYIGNRFYGAVLNKDPILSTLTSLKLNAMSGKRNEEAKFEKNIRFEPGLFLTSSVVPEDSLLNLLTSNESNEQMYVVQENDTPIGIAEKHGISYAFLRELNPDIDKNLHVGQEVLITVARPFMTVKSIFTDTYEEEIEYTTEEIQNVIYARGYREVTQEGKNGVRSVTAEITTVNGIESDRMEISSVTISEPVPEKVVVGVNVLQTPAPSNPVTQVDPSTLPPASGAVSSTGFIWPISSGTLTYGVGGYPGHTGIDIAGPAGTPIYASASGTVSKATRTYGGYGLHCIINHSDGFQTYYAHMSAMYVSVGEYVQQGQIIGLRGATGNSWGNHLHFEIRQNGQVKNPLKYVSP